MEIASRKRVSGSVEEVRGRLEEALKGEGFGVLTEIDVAAIFKARLGLERSPYRILGVCNPHLAQKVLAVDEGLGVLLPCTVVLRQEGHGVEVLVQDPKAMVAVLPDALREALRPMVEEAESRLRRVLEGL
ncbi:DUF302 domain-containing protein [Thermus sp.]|uniref:DUF302 domain-containing protein n=1 Tax=Thermus sp. TaxID=275 RepID=UPI00307F8778